MFKKFNQREDVSSQSQLKSSVQRNIRTKLIEQFPKLEPFLDELMPKKVQIVIVKCKDHINLLSVNNEILFFNHFDGPWFPTLKILHQFPFMLPTLQVDRGAIKFILSGANIMCPGLTSPGARMETDITVSPADIEKNGGKLVAVKAEGKESIVCVGLLKMGVAEIRKVNKGIAIENVHYLGDPLWRFEMV
ncbi:malignant T cell-amplified sequence 1-like protein [Paraphysoderma sedebokerense]|nr:malignant T cell-amplified sequence 1-like protein [Paraphysoderma sedebokerense]